MTATDTPAPTTIEEYRALLAEKDAEIENLKPTRDVTPFLFETEKDVVAFYGVERLGEMVNALVAQENKERMRKGFDRQTFSDAELKKRRDALIKELLEDRHRSRPPEEGWLARGIKMVKPDGSLVQIPYEVQVNNVAGSLGDGYVRYERKGYKRTSPMLCPTMDCNEVAAVNAAGMYLHSGYCTADHYDRTERGAAVPA